MGREGNIFCYILDVFFRYRSRSRSDTDFGPILVPFWNHFGTDFGPIWDQLLLLEGVLLDVALDNDFKPNCDQVSKRLRIDLGPSWDTC